MEHKIPESLREELAKTLAIYYASGIAEERGLDEAARAALCREKWERNPHGFRYVIRNTIEGHRTNIIT